MGDFQHCRGAARVVIRSVVNPCFLAGAGEGIASFAGSEMIVMRSECDPFVGLAGDAGEDVAIGLFDVLDARGETDFYAG